MRGEASSTTRMTLDQYLAKLGYGTRREVGKLVGQGHVSLSDGTALAATDRMASGQLSHDDIRVLGQPLDPPPGAVIVLHKPLGYVCSTTDANPVVYDLLPPRFVHRTPIMAPIGRLDRETSGLLLVTDDGQLNHRLTSPKSHVPKRYTVTLSDDLRGDEGEQFASGTLLLDREPLPLKPAALHVLGAREASITVTEGRYHQVRRMFAAVGNHVLTLHRQSIGGLALGDLNAGAWRVLTPGERAALMSTIAQSPSTQSTNAE